VFEWLALFFSIWEVLDSISVPHLRWKSVASPCLFPWTTWCSCQGETCGCRDSVIQGYCRLGLENKHHASHFHTTLSISDKLSTMKMEAAEPSKTSVNIYQTIQPHITQKILFGWLSDLKRERPTSSPIPHLELPFPLRRVPKNFRFHGPEQRKWKTRASCGIPYSGFVWIGT
jgi:hypothetical protein